MLPCALFAALHDGAAVGMRCPAVLLLQLPHRMTPVSTRLLGMTPCVSKAAIVADAAAAEGGLGRMMQDERPAARQCQLPGRESQSCSAHTLAVTVPGRAWGP